MIQKIFSLVFIFSTIIFSSQVQAQNLNNRQRVNSTLKLQTTAPGQYLTRHFNNFDETVARVTFGDVSTHTLYELVNEAGTPVLRLNGELLSATYEYNSWVLAQAMVQFEILEILNQYGLDSLPYNFVEFSQWSFLWAMRHWSAMGSPNNLDYANHPNEKIRRFPLSLQASVSHWDDLWKSSTLRNFLAETRRRHLSLGYSDVTLSQYAFRARGKHKEAANALLKRFRDLVFEECELRTPGECLRQY